jgi:hypothetical protein
MSGREQLLRGAGLRGAIVGVAAGVLLTVAVAAGAAAPPTEATYRKLCRSIQAEHVRALFTVPLAPIRLGGSSDCAFAPKGGNALVDGVQVFLRIDDGDQTLWKHRGDHPYGTFRTLTGAGQHAKWGYQGGACRRSSMLAPARSRARSFPVTS